MGHIREVDEDGERDWEGFEDDLNQVFGEYNLLLPFVSRRNELLGLVKDKSSCLSVLEKYPVEVLRSDLLHFIHEKKNCFSRTVIDQLVCDIADGRYTCTSFPHKKHVSTGDEIITRVSRKRCCREATLECQNRIAEGQKKLKHNENDISPSHVEKIKECIVARYNVSENDLQKRNTLGSQTGNLNLKRGYLHSLISKQSKVTNRPHEATAKTDAHDGMLDGDLGESHHGNRKNRICNKESSMRGSKSIVHENEIPGGIRNKQQFMQTDAHDCRLSGDLGENHYVDRKNRIRNKKSSTRETFPLPGARRVKLPWTKDEEEILKVYFSLQEGMNKFPCDSNGMKWKCILEHGKGFEGWL
ncbi:hypothetical protein SUGI_0499220 [Cryptomeria japonica]|nr:hypothetical protein SUGI_0499220 [Cryptomeria japonica]